MSIILVIDRTPIEVRVARVEEGIVTRLAYWHPGRTAPMRGALYHAKVTSIDKRMNAAFCDLGGESGFLRRPGKLPNEGEQLIVEVRREASGGKAAEVIDKATLRLPYVTMGESGEPRPGPLTASDEVFHLAAKQARQVMDEVQQSSALGRVGSIDPLIHLIQPLCDGGVDDVHVTDPSDRVLLQPYFQEQVPVERVEVSDIWPVLAAAEEDALARIVPLSGGGRLIVDETEAVISIDLDLGRQSGQSVKGAADRLLTEALTAMGAQSQLAQWGGQIVVDIPRGAIPAPKIIRDRLMRTFKPMGKVSVPAVTPEGLGIVILPRPAPSLLERLTGERVNGWVRHGRHWRTDVAAARAYRHAVDILAQNRTANFELSVSEQIAPYLTEGSASLARLNESFGPRLSVVIEATLNDREEAFHVRPR